MTEEETKNDETEKQLDVVEVEEQPKTTDEVWREVGQQFEALGKSLSQAFRATWESEETRKQVEKLEDGLNRATQKAGEVVKKAGSSPEAQKLREEAEKTTESLQAAGQKTWEDARPHLLSALTQFNTELQKMIDRLQQQEATPEESVAEDEPDVTEEQPEG